jgi:hypothetical protein
MEGSVLLKVAFGLFERQYMKTKESFLGIRRIPKGKNSSPGFANVAKGDHLDQCFKGPIRGIALPFCHSNCTWR